MSVEDELKATLSGLRELSGDSLKRLLNPGRDRSSYQTLIQRGAMVVSNVLGKDHLASIQMWDLWVQNYRRNGRVDPAEVSSAIKHVTTAINAVEVRALTRKPAEPAPGKPYVSPLRIAELQSVKSQKFDLTRLIRLCQELNIAHERECYMATAMLVRAIADHVPPIFGFKLFKDVASQYGGGKDGRSIKGNLQSLQESLRHIADGALHVTIRRSETLPTEAQVRFDADLDKLLEEVCRVLKHPEDTDPNSEPTSCNNGGR